MPSPPRRIAESVLRRKFTHERFRWEGLWSTPDRRTGEQRGCDALGRVWWCCGICVGLPAANVQLSTLNIQRLHPPRQVKWCGPPVVRGGLPPTPIDANSVNPHIVRRLETQISAPEKPAAISRRLISISPKASAAHDTRPAQANQPLPAMSTAPAPVLCSDNCCRSRSSQPKRSHPRR